MNLPPLSKEMKEKLGIAPDAVPNFPSVDFGLDLHKPQPRKERPLTTEDVNRMFGVSEAVKMNFVPQMLTALAFEQANEFVDYCRDNRIEIYKKHNREIRKCIEGYNRDLRDSYGRAYPAYERYLSRLREYVQVDLFKSWCSFTNEASKQFIGTYHKDIPARIAFIRMLFVFVEDLDKNVDKVIESKLGMPCRRSENPWIALVSALLIDMADMAKQKMQITDGMALCVKILARRCNAIAEEIMAEEGADSVRVIDNL